MMLLRQSFRPEFLNRLAEQQITCRLTDAAKQHIVDEAYDPEFGARPLRRYVQHTVETMLSRKILEGRITYRLHRHHGLPGRRTGAGVTGAVKQLY